MVRSTVLEGKPIYWARKLFGDRSLRIIYLPLDTPAELIERVKSLFPEAMTIEIEGEKGSWVNFNGSWVYN
jgi:hypothetical protein